MPGYFVETKYVAGEMGSFLEFKIFSHGVLPFAKRVLAGARDGIWRVVRTFQTQIVKSMILTVEIWCLVDTADACISNKMQAMQVP